MRQYASGTEVPVSKTQTEIEALLQKHGATRFARGWDGDRASLVFEIQGRQVRINLPLLSEDAFAYSNHNRRNTAAQKAAYQQDCAERWRALLLVLKAKLVAVEQGISTIEREFLSDVLLPDGRTVGEWVAPQLQETYATGRMPEVLPGAAKVLPEGRGQ